MDDKSIDEVQELIYKQVKEHAQALARRVFIFLVAGGISGGWYIGSGQLRPDPFTGEDGNNLRREFHGEISSLKKECREQLWHHMLEGHK